MAVRSTKSLSVAVLALMAGTAPLMTAARAGDSSSQAESEAVVPAATVAPRAEQEKSAAKPIEILEYRVEGTSVLSPSEIEGAVYPFLGPDKTAEDVEAARAALEKAYVAKGYQTVAVSIPPQQVQAGIVILTVVEGRVGRLRVKGSRYYDIDAIKGQAPSLQEGAVPNFNAVSDDIVALNQQADRKVTPSLRAGTTPGTVDVDLNVEDRFPLHGSLEFNNRHSANTTPYRLNGTLRYDNLWQQGHSISLSYQVAPENPKDAKVFSGSYLIRVPGWDKVNFLVYGVDQNSDVSSLGSMDVAGRGQVIGGRAIVTLPGEEGFFHTLSTGIDYKNFHEAVSLGKTGYDTPITYYPITSTWSGTWSGEGVLTQANAGATFHLRGLGSGPSAWDDKRYKAGGDFFYFRGDVSQMHDIAQGMQLFSKLQGQAANAPLISNEQFAAGGGETVRGYLESEVLGDSAALATLELRSPSLTTVLGDGMVDEWRFYTFADGGWLGTRDPLPEQNSTFSMASIGFGTKATLFQSLNGGADFAVPLLSQNQTKRYDPRVTFRVWSDF